MSAYAESRYNIVVPLKRGRRLVYNSLSASTAVLEADDCAALNRIATYETEAGAADAVLRDLLRGGFVVPADMDELQIARSEYEAQRYDPGQLTLTIAPTLACNFGCDYCFQGCDKPAGKMQQDVQDAVVALVERASRAVQRIGIAWYGGEPLLALPVIEALSERMRVVAAERRLGYECMIVTNGYRLTADVASRLHRQCIHTAQVTLDGDAESHDERRTTLGGQGTFARITRNLREVIDETPMKISVRVNIDARNAASVRELLDRLAAMGFNRQHNFSVYFAPVEAITEKCHVVSDLCMSKSAYGELEADLVRYAFDRQLTGLPYPPRFRGICGAMRPKGFVVAPTGDLHKCWDTISFPEHRIGTVFDLDALKTDARHRSWLQWTPFENEMCRNCRILPNCAGSCAHKFLNPEQTRGESASLPCPSWKYNIKERLVMMAEHRGAISAGDYDTDQIRTIPSELCR
jgi:uncharacterized protein